MMKKRVCATCLKKYEYDEENGYGVHCSTKCRNEQRYKERRKPGSVYGSGIRKNPPSTKDLSCCPGSIIDNVPGNIRYLISNLPSRPYVIEDIREINRAISEELPIAKIKGKQRKRRPMEEIAQKRAEWHKTFIKHH